MITKVVLMQIIAKELNRLKSIKKVNPIERGDNVTITKNELLRADLYRGKCSIKFLKKDNTERVMICTTNVENIPEECHPKPLAEGAAPRAKNENVIPVFDLEKQAWRSFRIDSLISFEAIA